MSEKSLPALGGTSFEGLKQTNQHGAEYWSARDLQPMLDYSQRRRFEQAVKRAIASSNESGNDPDHHFAGADKMVELGSGGARQVANMERLELHKYVYTFRRQRTSTMRLGWRTLLVRQCISTEKEVRHPLDTSYLSYIGKHR